MQEFVECESCQFVLMAADCEEPEPRHWPDCPGCGSTAFQFVDSE